MSTVGTTNDTQKVMVVFGTRPEAIKLAPVIKALAAEPTLEVTTCLTGQHRQMVEQVVRFFGLTIDHDLEIMKANQTLTDITTSALHGLQKAYEREKPDWVVVQGDTTTTFAAALQAFYQRVKVAHVEAGLRTYNKYSPYPEEMNRALTTQLADVHFAPTQRALEALEREGVPSGRVELTGNTVADALHLATAELARPGREAEVLAKLPQLDAKKRLVLVTGHRRESFGEPFRDFCEALKQLAMTEAVELVFPVHLNPNVRAPVQEILAGHANIHLIEPVDYPVLVWLATRCSFIVTDSGGIQEEAATLGKPVLVTRTTTERMESVDAGVSKLVGTSRQAILEAARALLHDSATYAHMSRKLDLYGDGKASTRIARRIANWTQEHAH